VPSSALRTIMRSRCSWLVKAIAGMSDKSGCCGRQL
jgi:hypothetical protein